MPKSTPKPKRAIATALEESTHPPPALKQTQTIAKLCKAEGNHLYSVTLPENFNISGNTNESSDPSQNLSKIESLDKDESNDNPSTDPAVASTESHLVELPSTLRGAVFFRRNGYVLIDTDRELLGGRENKIVGMIVGVVLGGKAEREWRGMQYWPAEFGRERAWDYDSEDDEGPRMPSDSSEEGED